MSIACFAETPLSSETNFRWGGAVNYVTVHVSLVVGVAAGVVAAGVMLAVLRRAWWRRQVDGARLLAVRAPVTVDPAGALVLWRALTGLLAPWWKRLLVGQLHLAVEYGFDQRGARVAVWVPAAVPPGLVEHAIGAAWPGAQVSIEPASNPLPDGARAVAGGLLGLGASEWFPIRTVHDSDPLRPLFHVGTHLAPDEAVCVQVLARPVTGRRVRRLRSVAWSLRNHRTPETASVAGVVTAVVRVGLDLLQPGPARPAGSGHRSVDPFATEDLRAVREKTAHPLWEVAVRYAAATTTDRHDGRARVRGVAHEVASAFAVFTGRNHLRRHRLRHSAPVLAGRRLRHGFVLSVPELAGLAHLPYDDHVPGLVRAGARAVVPTPLIPSGGKVLGDADAGPTRPIALTPVDARHHLHVIGSTGSGKSTLLANLALADVRAGRGVVVIDPKGDLVRDIADRLPPAARNRLVVIDPDAPRPWPALNVLDGPDSDLVADHVVGIFRRIYAAWWGPRTDDVLRAAVLTLLHPANRARPDVAHLGSVPRLLTEDAFRRRITTPAMADDAILRGFWSWYDGLSEAARAQVTGPVMNKLRAVLLRRFARATLATGRSTLDMGRILDGGICLVRIPKGILGADASRLLGSFVLARAWQTATARARIGEGQRRDAGIVLDEAHNFLTLPHGIDDMLAEARAYRISLVLAHQNLAQLPRELKEGISANARNKVFFTCSPEDAAVLERHVAPTLTAHDLAHLEEFQAATRLIVAARPTPACTLRTRPLPEPQRETARRAG